jgi:hypothetical protein
MIGSLDLNHRERNSQANFIIEQDLDMVGAVFLKLHAAEEMDVRCMGIKIIEAKGDLCLRDRLILLGIIDKALLDKVTTASAPTTPKAEFEKADRQVGSRDRTDDADQSLLTTQFRADILAENGGLQVW